jgi:predicted transcriptional regulator
MTRAKRAKPSPPVTEEEEYDPTEEQEASIAASIAEVERGEFVDGDEMLAELRRRRGLHHRAANGGGPR